MQFKLPTPEEREAKQAEMDARAIELTQREGGTVHPLLFVDKYSGEFVTGFMKEPPIMTKLMILDKGLGSAFSTCAGVLSLYMIEDESDRRLYKESSKSEDQVHYLGAISFMVELVRVSQDLMKKK